ncbi:MAG: energy transducer TonB [Bacteroidota bacterium]
MNYSLINSAICKQLLFSFFILSFFSLSTLSAQNKAEKIDQYPQCTNLAEVQQAIGYPKAAAKEGIEGKVFVKVKVDTEGKVVSSEILKGSPEALAESVEPHIKSLTFTPSQKDGKAVATMLTIPFMFKLGE